MAEDIKLQLGSFMRNRKPDTAESPFSAGGVPEPGKDFLQIAVDPDPGRIRPTSPAPAEPSEAITLPEQVPFQPAPPTPLLGISPSQPSQDPGTIPVTPTSPPPTVTPTSPSAFQPPIALGSITPDPPLVDVPQSPTIQPSPPQPSQDPGLSPPTLFFGGLVYNTPLPAIDRTFVTVDNVQHVPAALQQVDSAVAAFLKNVTDPGDDPTKGPFSAVGGGAPGSQGWNPQLYGRQLVRLGQDVQKTALFAIQQIGLYGLNWHGRIWNPATLAPAPETELINPGAIDTMTGGTSPVDLLPGGLGGEKFYSNNELVNDRHLQLRNGVRNEALGLPYPPFVATVTAGGSVGPQNIANLGTRLIGANSQDSSMVDNPLIDGIPGTPLLEAAFTQRNLYGPEQNGEGSYNKNQLTRMSELFTGTDPAMVDDTETGLKRFSTTSLFTPKNVSLGSSTPTEYRWKGGLLLQRAETRSVDPLQKSAFMRGVVPAGFKAENNGFLQRGQGTDPATLIDDDEAYVPLSFTDIRPYGNGKVRTVYFRPFITNLSEELSPEWSKISGFGRVDPVVGYAGTTRTINLGFIVHSFAPSDLTVIYQKLLWLSSMVYPEYDKDLAYKSGPVARLRIGDLISSTNPGGLGGIIEGLTFEYSDQIWELQKNSKVPMGYRVALSFTVLHDTPIGRGIDGKFGGLGTIDQNGLYKPPSSVQSTADATKKGPDVEDSSAFRNFVSDSNDYDPTA